MPFLDKIVSQLNEHIEEVCSKCVETQVKTFGITELIVDNAADTIMRYPLEISEEGEGTRVAVDDRFGITLYHRLLNLTSTIDSTKAFGDKQGKLFEQANLGLVVIAFRPVIKKTASWLESIIKDTLLFTSKITNTEGKTWQLSNVKPSASSFDKPSILTRDFENQDLRRPDLIVFEISYRIESSYTPGCLLECYCYN